MIPLFDVVSQDVDRYPLPPPPPPSPPAAAASHCRQYQGCTKEEGESSIGSLICIKAVHVRPAVQ